MHILLTSQFFCVCMPLCTTGGWKRSERLMFRAMHKDFIYNLLMSHCCCVCMHLCMTGGWKRSERLRSGLR